MWTEKQIAQHIEAAQKLGIIKNDVANFILLNKNTDELLVQKFVLKKMKEYGLKMDKDKPIVAFGKNTSFVHYFPNKLNKRQLKNNTLILLDIWARLNQPRAPYADMTWMFYYGKKVPNHLEKFFQKVMGARDLALGKMVKDINLGVSIIGGELNQLAVDYFGNLKNNFKHSLGHSLGTVSPHGIYAGFHRRNRKNIIPNLAYTIEPGLYFTNRFGFRSEIDVLWKKNGQIIITTPLQKKIEIIK